ncbi:MAG: DUF1700 domain-containing protein [Hespellia sp.]|nr:DUF1700 domain-containing protein [Hespellia sp.]
MTRSEFLQELRDALQNESLSSAAIQENVNYYNGYISEEIAKGRNENAVLEELGDPWVIAKGIVDSPGSAYYQPDAVETVYEEAGSRQQSSQSSQNSYKEEVHVFGLDSWWKKLLAILAVVMMIVVIIAIVSGVVSLLAPIIIPVVIVMIVIRLIGGRR